MKHYLTSKIRAAILCSLFVSCDLMSYKNKPENTSDRNIAAKIAKT